MSKLTQGEIQEVWDTFTEMGVLDYTQVSAKEVEARFILWLQDMKTQWQEEAIAKVKERLKFCEDQNGVSYCKNCGLSKDDLTNF